MVLIFHELGHFLVFSVLFLIIKRAITLIKKFPAKLLNIKHYLVGLFVTIFMDLDHLFDYYMYKGWNFDLKGFFASESFEINQKAYVLLHAWELVLLFFIIYVILEKSKHYLANYVLMIVLGMTVHITYDVVYYDIAWGGYLFYNRFVNNFDILVLEGIY